MDRHGNEGRTFLPFFFFWPPRLPLHTADLLVLLTALLPFIPNLSVLKAPAIPSSWLSQSCEFCKGE